MSRIPHAYPRFGAHLTLTFPKVRSDQYIDCSRYDMARFLNSKVHRQIEENKNALWDSGIEGLLYYGVARKALSRKHDNVQLDMVFPDKWLPFVNQALESAKEAYYEMYRTTKVTPKTLKVKQRQSQESHRFPPGIEAGKRKIERSIDGKLSHGVALEAVAMEVRVGRPLIYYGGKHLQ